MAARKITPETVAARPTSAVDHVIPLVSAMGIAEANRAANFPVPTHVQDIINAATPEQRQAVLDARPKAEPATSTPSEEA